MSETVAANVTGAPHWPVALPTTMFAGGTIVGFWLSITVIRKEQVAVRPVGLVAVATTVVIPGPNRLPEGGLYVTVTPGQLETAVAAYVNVAPH